MQEMKATGFDLQGHRGARGLRPENSLPAFDLALRLGVTTLEMDACISGDLKVIVSHDPFISSTICAHPDGSPVTDSEAEGLRLFDLSYDQIRAFDCGSRQHPDFPDQLHAATCKPLLSAVIDYAERRVSELGRRPVYFNIETKSTLAGDGRDHPGADEFADLVLDVVENAGIASRTTIQSFDYRTIRRARERGHPVRISMLADTTTKGDFGDQVVELGFLPHIYSPDYRMVSDELVERAETTGVEILPWTVNEKKTMSELIAMDIRGFITDYPDRAIEVLTSAGLW